MKLMLRWLGVVIVVFALITFPRGYLPPPLHADVTSPLPVFTWSHWGKNVADLANRILTLHFGMTADGRPLLGLVLSQFRPSLILVLFSFLFVLVLGVAKGIIDGFQQTGRLLRTLSAASQWVAESIPDFFIIIALEYLFFFLARKGIIKLYIVGNNHFVMGTLVPAFILALIPMMYLARIVRSKVDEQYGQQYLVTASAKGLTASRVLWRHLLPNIVPTIFEAAIPAMGLLLSNLMLVEYLTYRNGIVAGIFDAMGSTVYAPDSFATAPPTNWYYLPFDVNRMFLYALGIFLIFAVFLGVVRLILWVLGWRGQRNTYADSYRSPENKRWRWKFWVGGSVLGLILILGVFARKLPIPNPFKEDVIHFDGTSMSIPPFPPSGAHLLGTDATGHDMLSQTLYATIPSFGYVGACLIVILAVSLLLGGMSSLWKMQWVRSLIQTWNALTTVTPSVVLAAFLLTIPAIAFFDIHTGRLEVYWSVGHEILYLIIICVVELGRSAYRIQTTLDDLESKMYMEAAIISGNSVWSRFWIHHWRTFRLIMLEHIVTLFSRVLLVIATLGFINLPMSGTWHYYQGWAYNISTGDWGGILALNVHDFLSSGYSWLVFAPALFITLTIVSLNLIQEGIREKAQAVPESKKTPTTQSPVKTVMRMAK